MQPSKLLLLLSLLLLPTLARAQWTDIQVGGTLAYTSSTAKVKGLSSTDRSFTFSPWASMAITDNIFAGLELAYTYGQKSHIAERTFGVGPFAGYKLHITERISWMPRLIIAPRILSTQGAAHFGLYASACLGRFAVEVADHWRLYFGFAQLGYDYTSHSAGNSHRFALRLNPLENSSVSVAYAF